MAILVPDGLLPSFRPLSDTDVLTGPVRVTEWRFERLNAAEEYVGELVGVTGGSVEWTATASIKGGGSITLETDPQVDWLNERIRPVATIKGIDAEFPAGIWLAASPDEDWSSTGVGRTVALLDKASILDTDVWTDPATGMPRSYAVAAGANVVETVRALISETGESAAAIPAEPTTITRALVWPPETTRLRIINDLLDAAGFFSLWVDMFGQFQVTKYRPPSSRAPVYEVSGAFTVGPASVVAPDFQVTRDIYAIPNRFVAIGQGTSDEEAMIAVATNTNPSSPFSFPSRGRWVTEVETGVEAASLEAMQTYADRRLVALTSVAAAVSLEHLYMPNVQVNSTVRLVNRAAGLDGLFTIAKTGVEFDSLSLCKTELQEVISL